jgi:hypothetical protein
VKNEWEERVEKFEIRFVRICTGKRNFEGCGVENALEVSESKGRKKRGSRVKEKGGKDSISEWLLSKNVFWRRETS